MIRQFANRLEPIELGSGTLRQLGLFRRGSRRRRNHDEQNRAKAVVLLSGGLDSTTVLAIANAEGYETYALSFSYGQRHSWELECARRVASTSGVKDHRVAQIDLRVFGGSALTAISGVPKGRSLDEMSEDIPVTYVPARNTIFLSFASGVG